LSADSLNKRYSVKLVSSIISGIVNAIIVALVPSAMGPVAYGQLTYLQQIFNQITSFADAGTSTAFFTKLSANNNRKELISHYLLFSMFLLVLLSSALGIVVFFGFSDLLSKDISAQSLYLGLFLGFVVWFTQIAIKISDAYALTVTVEVLKIVYKIVFLLSLIIVIYGLTLTLDVFLFFQIVAGVFFLAILFLYFYKENILSGCFEKGFSGVKSTIDEFFVYVSPLFVFNAVSIVIAFFEIWLLQYFGGAESVGFYGLAYSIAAMCFVFTSAMTPVLTREFSRLYEVGRNDEILKLFDTYLPLLYFVAAYFGVFIAYNSTYVLSVFADERFSSAALTLSIMALYPLHQTYGQITSSLFFASGETRTYRNIGLLSALIGLALVLLFVLLFDMKDIGFAVKMLVAQFIGVNIQLYYNCRMLKGNFPKLFYAQLKPLFSVYLIVLLSDYLNPFGNETFFGFLVFGIVYSLLVVFVVVYRADAFGLCQNSVSTLVRKIRNKVLGDRSC
jgi:O-antigen/teichoic acid export membrane protein